MELIKEYLIQHPFESIEMIITYSNTVLNNYLENLTQKELVQKIQAFIYNLERLFGAKAGTFASLVNIFIITDNNREGESSREK